MNQRVPVAEHELCQGLGEKGFADSGRSEENERTNRPAWILEVGARAAQRFGNRDHRFVLTHDFSFQFGFHLQQLFRFLLFHSLQRNTRDFRNDGHHIVRRNHDFFFFTFLAPFSQNRVESFLGLFFLVAQTGGFLEILGLDCGLLFAANNFDIFLDFLHVGRTRHGVDAGAGAGFVHDIDCFVRQKSSRDIALRKFHRDLERLVRQLRFVMCFVFRSQPFQNLNGLFNGWCFHLHRLEAPLQRRVFFDVLAVLVQGRCTDTLQLAAAQRRFDDIARIHRALGRARADNGV